MTTASVSPAVRRTPGRIGLTLIVAMLATILAPKPANAAPGDPVFTALTADDGDNEAVEAGSTNGDGFLDSVFVTFSVPMDTASLPDLSTGPGDPGFRVEGYTIAYHEWEPGGILRLDLIQQTQMDTGETPRVVYEAGDSTQTAAGEPIPGWDGNPVDGAGPVLKAVYANDQAGANGHLFNSTGDELLIEFSEPATLAGASKVDRWLNMERAIRFEQSPANGCPRDGIGLPTDRNFPQPGTTNEVVDKPAGPTDYVSVFRVSQKTDSIGSTNTHTFAAFPSGCWVGLDIDYHGLISDAAGNLARAQDEPCTAGCSTPTVCTGCRRERIHIADTEVVTLKTLDGAGGDPNGTIDALELRVSSPFVDSSVSASQFTVKRTATSTASATITSVDTGAADDRFVNLRFTPPNGETWDTGVRPFLSYTKPADCTETGGSGAKATVPASAVGFQSCLATFSVQASDTAFPMIVGSQTADADADGLLDGVRVTFSEQMSTVGTAGWTVRGAAPSSVTLAADTTKADLVIAESGTAGDTGTLPQLKYTTSTTNVDAAGNQVRPSDAPVATDAAVARMRNAWQYDLDGDGRIERAVVRFSEDLVEPAAGAAANFTVDGSTASFATPAAGDDDPDAVGDGYLSLGFAPASGTGPEAVVYTPGSTDIADAAGNALTTQTFAAADVIDKAIPRVMDVTPRAIPSGTPTISLQFSESMGTAIPPLTKLSGETVASVVAPLTHTNGWRNDDPSIWEGTITIASDRCGISTGCPEGLTATDAKDPAGNLQAALARAIDVDTMAPSIPTLDDFAAVIEAGKTAPDDTINMFTDGFTVTGTIPALEAEGGSAEILVNGNPLSPQAIDDSIDADDTTVSAATGFTDRAALQAAIPAGDGSHDVTLRLCDDALNCVTSSVKAVTADYTPVTIDLEEPSGGSLHKGGTSVNVSWVADPDGVGFDHVVLEYSPDGGTTWSSIAERNEADSIYAWTLPSINSGDVLVRSTSVDVNGNEADDASPDPLEIDSAAPAVTITAPSATNPYLRAGAATTVRWTATDAHLDGVTDPITIEYSTNRGSTWQEINGGSYSSANDGAETWNVPSGKSLSTWLRVSAVDEVGNLRVLNSAHLAKGVAGWIPNDRGYIHGYGTATDSVSESKFASNWTRGIAIQGNNRAGYVVGATGRLYPFAASGTSKPSRPSTSIFSSDRARGLVLRTDTSGYVLHMYGKLYRFGGAPTVRYSKTWSGYDNARDVVLRSDERGGYVLDKYGRLHPFALGSYALPPQVQSRRWFSTDRARAVILRSDDRSGWILEHDGDLYPFGGAPTVKEYGRRSTANAKGVVAIEPAGGFWLDGRGRMNRWGTASWMTVNPSRFTIPAAGVANFS